MLRNAVNLTKATIQTTETRPNQPKPDNRYPDGPQILASTTGCAFPFAMQKHCTMGLGDQNETTVRTDLVPASEIFTLEEAEEARRTLLEGLRATRTKRVGRDPAGLIQYDEVPDYRERRECAALILGYRYGRPVNKLVTKSLDAGEKPLTQAELLARLKEDPDFMARTAQDYLDGLKSAEVVDSDPVKLIPGNKPTDIQSAGENTQIVVNARLTKGKVK